MQFPDLGCLNLNFFVIGLCYLYLFVGSFSHQFKGVNYVCRIFTSCFVGVIFILFLLWCFHTFSVFVVLVVVCFTPLFVFCFAFVRVYHFVWFVSSLVLFYWFSCCFSFLFCFILLDVFLLNIVIRNGKIVWRLRPNCWYFHLNLKYLGEPYRVYIKTAKNGNFCDEMLSENQFEVVLATFCCYDHGTKVSGAVQKIATDQKEYRKCSSCVVICWIAKIKMYLPIDSSEKWLVTRIPPT